MNKSNGKSLILLLGNYRPSLTLARTFKGRGFDVSVGTHGCERLCQHSNAVREMWSHSPLNSGPAVLAEELRSYASSHPDLVAIIPVAEEYVRIIAEHEELFADLPKIVSMDSDLVLKCLDKDFMLNLARRIELPIVPFATTLGLVETLKVAGGKVQYPLILRSKDSTKRLGGNKAICIDNEEELIECFTAHHLEKRELLIQQKFSGKRHNIYFAASDGVATRLLHAVIDRTDKPDGTGLAVEGRTLGADHALVRQTQKLLKALDYCGIGCAQFLVDETTGQTTFLEINPRIAGNHALPEHAGLDLGWFNFERVVHQRVNYQQVISSGGLRYCWSTGDLMGAKVSFLRGEIGMSAFMNWSLKTFVTMIRSDLHMVFSFKDPMPALRAVWNLLPRINRFKRPEIHPGESTIYLPEHRRPK